MDELTKKFLRVENQKLILKNLIGFVQHNFTTDNIKLVLY
jgi:hypothetical protein